MQTNNKLDAYVTKAIEEIDISEKPRPILVKIISDASSSTSRFIDRLSDGVRASLLDIKSETDDPSSIFVEVDVFSSMYGDDVRNVLPFQALLDADIAGMPNFVSNGGTPMLAALCDSLDKFYAIAAALKLKKMRCKGILVGFGDGDADDSYLASEVLDRIAKIEALETCKIDRFYIGMLGATVGKDLNDPVIKNQVDIFDADMLKLCDSIGFQYLPAGTRISAVTALIRKSVVASGGQMADSTEEEEQDDSTTVN